MLKLDVRNMFDNSRMPLVVRPISHRTCLADELREYRERFDELLLEHGAILFRGFDVNRISDFELFVEAAAKKSLRYINRSTPRSSVGKGIFSATEYPANQEIPLHCENAYQNDWPLKVAFCCLIAPVSGGQTPIADMQRVSSLIGQELMGKFETNGVKYVRHYRPHVDIPWDEAFQTSDRKTVEDFCERNGIQHRWLSEDTLRTEQTCQGTAIHPITHEKIFFNQAHLFHISNLPPRVASSLVEIYGMDRLPRNSFYGNGMDISTRELAHIRDAYRSAAVSFDWKSSDVLLLDNMRAAHGRYPFVGERQVLATLMESRYGLECP